MNTAARRIGRTLLFVLPVVLVLSGALAVTRASWAAADTESRMLTAPSESSSPSPARARPPQDMLRERLLAELQEQNAHLAPARLQEGANRRPSLALAKHCSSLARALGRAAVRTYGTGLAYAFARPVRDRSFAAGAGYRSFAAGAGYRSG